MSEINPRELAGGGVPVPGGPPAQSPAAGTPAVPRSGAALIQYGLIRQCLTGARPVLDRRSEPTAPEAVSSPPCYLHLPPRNTALGPHVVRTRANMPHGPLTYLSPLTS